MQENCEIKKVRQAEGNQLRKGNQLEGVRGHGRGVEGGWGSEDRPTWTAGFDKGASNRAVWPISAVSGQPGSSWSASSGLVSALLAWSHPGRGALAGRAGLSAPSGIWLGQCFFFKTRRFPR